MRIRWCVLTIAILFSLGSAVWADLNKDSIWNRDFKTAEAEAKRLKRPLVIHFGAKWCTYCVQMENDLLTTPPMLKLLDSGFIAVKVDIDKNPALKERFKIDSLPADLIVSPDGKVLAQTKGYNTEIRQRYLQEIGRIDKQYAQSGTRLPKSTPIAGESTQIATNDQPAKPATQTAASGEKLVPQPTEPKKVEAPQIAQTEKNSAADELEIQQPQAEPQEPQVAMEGYCAVTLRNTRTWKKGSADFTLEHQGLMYQFQSATEMKEFQGNPERFAPRLLGCDAVELGDNNLAVRGSTRFGAYYDGALYLFESAESRTKFKKAPARYALLKHSLKPEELKRLASADDK
jgi:YHS domain-containing protein/thiol-disulfide isomerase/thioredoxin